VQGFDFLRFRSINHTDYPWSMCCLNSGTLVWKICGRFHDHVCLVPHAVYCVEVRGKNGSPVAAIKVSRFPRLGMIVVWRH
jgi:hypothetical protein